MIVYVLGVWWSDICDGFERGSSVQWIQLGEIPLESSIDLR